jgi:hypothetical protein
MAEKGSRNEILMGLSVQFSEFVSYFIEASKFFLFDFLFNKEAFVVVQLRFRDSVQ